MGLVSKCLAAVQEEVVSFGRHVQAVVVEVVGSTIAQALAVVAVVLGAVVGGPSAAQAQTWPTGLDPTTVSNLFTVYIYAAIPIVVGVMAVLTGVWFVIHAIHSFVVRKG